MSLSAPPQALQMYNYLESYMHYDIMSVQGEEGVQICCNISLIFIIGMEVVFC